MSVQGVIRAPQVFNLVRDEDKSGVSGVGTVAQGIVWPDGTCAMRWISGFPSTAIYDSLDDLLTIHGHGGTTRVEFIATPEGG